MGICLGVIFVKMAGNNPIYRADRPVRPIRSVR